MIATHIITRPVITERSMKDAELGRFTFVVAKSADKTMIKSAVETLFNVSVIKIMTVTTKGRSVRAGAKRQEISLSPIKKAIVTLKKGQKIPVFEVGA